MYTQVYVSCEPQIDDDASKKYLHTNTERDAQTTGLFFF